MTWQTAKLGEVCDVRDGTHDSPKYTETGFPLITSKNLVNGYIDTLNASYISEADYINIGKRSKVDCGDILMPMIGTIGNPVVVDDPSPAFAIKNVALIKFTDKSPDRSFIKSVLQSQLFKTYVDNVSRGGTQKFLSLGDIRKFSIPLPPLPEQKRIAAILDKADELKRKREAAIAKLDQLAQSIFVEMFGDPLTNPKKYECLCLQEIAIKITDGEHLNPEFSEQGMPIVMAGNVLEDSIDFENAKNVKVEFGEKFRKKCNPEPNDILVVSRGATIGRMTIVHDLKAFCLMGSVILIKLNKNKVDPSYLSTLLKFPYMRSALYKTSGSSAQQAIYLKDLKNLSCIVPPLNLQLKFSERLKAINSIKAINTEAIVKQSTLFTSLQHQAFAGQL